MTVLVLHTLRSLVRFAVVALVVATSAGSVCCAPRDGNDSGFTHLLGLMDDSAFEEVFDRSFEIVLSDSQRLEYTAIAARGRALYRRRFWLRNDPTPATNDNELLNEFARRIDYALSNFCVEDSLTWDDRGDIVIRFGVPASRMGTIGDFGRRGQIIYPTEMWYYPRMGMSVEFVGRLDGGGYVLGSNAPAPSGGTAAASAVGIPPVTEPVDPGVEVPDIAREVMAIEGEHIAYKAQEIAARGLMTVENVPMSYGYSPPAPPIMVYYEIVTAKGPDGLTDVAVNYQVPVSSLALTEDADRAAGSIVKRLRILDGEHGVVASEVRRLSVSCESTPAPGALGPAGRLVTDEWRLDAPPGEYTIEIAVEDTVSGRVGFGRSRTFVRGYRGRYLSMSGIQLATAVGEGSRFRRMDGTVTPNPSRAFWRDEKLIVYFELYGLAEDRPGESRFTVTTEVSPRAREEERNWLVLLFSRKEREHAVSSRVVAVGHVPDTAHWFSLGLSTLPEDNYDLTITVKDVRSKREVTESTPFTVMEKR